MRKKPEMTLSALWYLGRENVDAEVIRRIREGLSEEAFERLCASSITAWIASAIDQYGREPIGSGPIDRVYMLSNWSQNHPKSCRKLDRTGSYAIDLMAEREGWIRAIQALTATRRSASKTDPVRFVEPSCRVQIPPEQTTAHIKKPEQVLTCSGSLMWRRGRDGFAPSRRSPLRGAPRPKRIPSVLSNPPVGFKSLPSRPRRT